MVTASRNLFPRPKPVDRLNVNARLYNQIAKLLDDLEEQDAEDPLDIKTRIAALIAIGRIQTVFVGLRKENRDGGPGAGSAVRKYARAFKTDGARGGTKDTRRPRRAAAEQLPDDDFIDDGDDAA